MNIEDIATAMAQKFAIEELHRQDGLLEVEIDGALVQIEETDGDDFIFKGLIGDPPSDGGEVFAKIALESNMALMHTKAMAITRDPESSVYVLIERIPRAHVSDFEIFCDYLGKFMDTLDLWRNMLHDFSPAKAMAALDADEKEAQAVNALRYGFLRA
ncbi:MAG: type III secretion system chaperone [Desulfovibrionaceae bacterium]|nr:type III secretion system chaperone [Desulfovibrionaceae bacterium]